MGRTNGSGLGSDNTLDVSELSPGLQQAVHEEANVMGGIRSARSRESCRAAGGVVTKPPSFATPDVQRRGFACELPPSFYPVRAKSNHAGFGMGLGQFVPKLVDPLAFVAGLGTGTTVGTAAARGLSKVVDLNPIWTTGGWSVLTLAAHILSGSSFTFGLFAGSVPLLLEQGVSSLVDLVWPTKSSASVSGTKLAGAAGSGNLGQLTRRSVEEIQRLMRRLQPGAGMQGAPAMQGVTQGAPPAIGAGLAENANSYFPSQVA